MNKSFRLFPVINHLVESLILILESIDSLDNTVSNCYTQPISIWIYGRLS